jgi:hypothetical protein
MWKALLFLDSLFPETETEVPGKLLNVVLEKDGGDQLHR